MGHLTAITPVEPGREAALRQAIAALAEGAASPFARLPGTHFARLVVIPELVYQGHGQRPDVLRTQYLLYASEFDGARGRHLAELRERIPDVVDAVWSHCSGYPGAAAGDAFGDYLERNSVPPGFSVASYPHASVARVRESLALRERVAALARRGSALDAAELLREWRELAP